MTAAATTTSTTKTRWPSSGPLTTGIRGFESKGCFTACHDGENEDVKPYGNKYTDEGMGDIWHWKSVRNLDQIDDQYLDSTQYSPIRRKLDATATPRTAAAM